MKLPVRRIAGPLAIIAIGLHTALWGVISTSAPGAAADPLSVICHSGGDAASDQAPAGPVHSRACEHCNLCGTPAASPSPVGVAVAVLEPAEFLHVLVPPAVRPADGVIVKSASARGPPVSA
ncbi:MAG TPA: DUF2946 family protein [Pseudolabrys sp.]|nr:DUF2946 family protein [Pseudolabrys sp.]